MTLVQVSDALASRFMTPSVAGTWRKENFKRLARVRRLEIGVMVVKTKL